MGICSLCSKEVPDDQLSYRDEECPECRAADKATDMTVGDLGGR